MKLIHIFVVSAICCVLFQCCEKKKEESYNKEAMFIYGTMLLSSSQEDIKKEVDNFKKLKDLTGVSTDSIITFLDKKIRNSPEEGKKLYETINRIIGDSCSSKELT
ncbi:MAG: hypothetical protein N2053_04770, partial [Chitinispirillaceae bacterium]|nr:hypothetical protein [Chitinispirillaceae bacterium]